ncbi:Ankyrin-3 [Araneus ventricosus]|uniref:Ankyrin-3 n=1 Tax=Araneus ventricosus TaxID=182803 RepID=A0A4Y2L8C0_ARAVE|nr:Ankyrin-3 [Araneus ventricosus]
MNHELKYKDMGLYVQILRAIKSAVIDDDVDSCKVSCALMKYVNETLNCETAKEYQRNAHESFGNVNLICLACKSGAVKVLQHLLSNENSVCSLPNLTKKRNLLPEEEDEESHNAIYYAIRCNKTRIPEIVIGKWLNDYFKENSGRLDDLLSKALHDLMVRNVYISEDMKMYIKSKLVDLRFFNDTSQNKNIGKLSDTQNLKDLTILRIDFVFDSITCLIKQFWNLEPNEQFLLYSKNIAKNIHMLKSRITCKDRLPWEEIEFCLIIFIRSCQSCFQQYPLYHFVLNKHRLLKHLKTFSQIFIKLKDKIRCANKSKFGKLLIDEINGIENIVDLKELYDDFAQIRDLYSLEKIKSCIDLAMSANIVEKYDQLIIIRALQVIGECMKDSVDSPNLSVDTFELLHSSLPDNIKDVLTQLRDSLSHAEYLSLRFEIETSGQQFFKSLQSDIAQMNLAITSIIRSKKAMIIGNLLSKMRCCKDIEALKLFLKENQISVISVQKELKEAQNLSLINIEQLEKLFFEVEREIKDELNCSLELICRTQNIVQNACAENASNSGGSLDSLKSDLPTDFEELQQICTDFLHLTLNPQETDVESISPITFNIPENTEKICKTLSDILYELKRKESFSQKIISYSNTSAIPQLLLKLRNKKDTKSKRRRRRKKKEHQIKEDDIKECERLITNLKIESINKASRFEKMFQKFRSVIHSQKTKLRHSQKAFRQCLKKLINIIKLDNEERFDATLIRLLQEAFEFLTSWGLSLQFSSDLSNIFQSITSELNRDNLAYIVHFTNAFNNMQYFLEFGLDKIKSIKEFKQMLQSHKQRQLQKSPERISDLTQLKILLSHKLHLLEEISNEYHGNKMFFENSMCSQEKLKLLSVIEMLTLDCMTILGCLPDRLAHNAFFLDNDYPVLNGKNLRNYLAHGNALVSIVLGNDCTDIFLNAEKMITHDLLKPGRQIGKKEKNDPLKLKVSLERDLSTVNTQLKLFLALTEGEIEEVKDCLSRGGDMFGTDLSSQTSLHFAAKGTCLEMVKYVLKFNSDVSAVDINLQSALHVASFYGRLAVVECLIQESNALINRRDINGRTPLHLASINGHTDVVRCLLKHRAKVAYKDLSGNDALHHAVIHNHIDIVNILLEKESNDDINRTFFGVSALHLASENGHMNLVVTLLEKININFKSDVHYVPLHYAATGGHADVVLFLIAKGADINAKSLKGLTPLHFAASNDHYEVVEILLQHGADMNAADLNGATPLSFAAMENSLETLKLLLKEGAVVDNVKNSFWCPLNLAAFYGHRELVQILFDKYDTASQISALNFAAYMGHLSIVELLESNEMNVLRVDNGCTALHMAACEGHTEVVNFLISKGYDVNAKADRNELEKNLSNEVQDTWHAAISSFFHGDLNLVSRYLFSGKTALHLCAAKKHKDTVRSLLKNQADICIKDDTGSTPLRIIIRMGMANILVDEKVPLNFAYYDNFNPLQLGVLTGDLLFVKYCVEQGCNINSGTNCVKLTTLHIAVFRGHAEVVSYLIDCGADVNALISDDHTALEIAVRINRKDIVSILINKGAEISAEKEREYLMLAIRSGYEEIVNYFLARSPANAASRPECNEFPLHIAVLYGHINILEMLLELEKRKDINDKNKDSLTPLLIASDRGYCEITRLLLANGADPNNMSGQLLPLHMAVVRGHSELIEILIKAGANVTLRDGEGSSAIELAIMCRNLEIMETLLELSKLDINLKGHNGRTLLHDAAISGSLQIVKSLVDKGAAINDRDSTDAKPIHIAAKEGHQDIVEYFLSEGLDIDDRGENGWCLLHYAAAGNQFEICECLLKNSLNFNAVDAHGCTPLHVAARMGNADVLHTLLYYGAYYDFRNERNETPIDVAIASPLGRNVHIIASLTFISSLFSEVRRNDIQKVEALLSKGMEFSEFGYANVKSVKGLSVLHYAAQRGYEEIVNLLLKYHADPNVKEANGCTPLHYAAKFSHPRIANALLRHGAMFDAECNSKKTPVDYTNNRDVIKILEFLKTMFLKIQNDESFLISDSLMNFGDDIAKTVIRARNSCGRTLTALAVIKEHPEVDTLKSLFQPDVTFHFQTADRLYKEEQFEESIQEYKIILEKRIDLFGDEDPGVLDIQENISSILIDQGKFDDAQNLIEKFYRIRKEILGDCNKDTLAAMKLMALVLKYKGRKEEALNMFENVLNKQKDILGSDNTETLQTEIQIICLMCEEEIEIEESTKALNLCFEILDRLNKFPEVTDLILDLKTVVAFLLFNLGIPSETLDILKDVFEIEKEMFGLYHSKTSDTLFCMASVLYLINEEEDSLEAFRQTHEIRHRVLGPNNEKTLDARFWVANILYLQRMFHEAFEIYKADLEARTAILGANHPNILCTRERIDFVGETGASLVQGQVYTRLIIHIPLVEAHHMSFHKNYLGPLLILTPVWHQF